MTRFDEMFRRGLMDANLAQFEPALRRANDMQPDFSPRYLRERTRMLADPWEWARRRSVRRRIDWRLIAIAAALLLLSACAYAVVTGQFAQWFPGMRMDPDAPEVSEEVVSRMGTVIGQSQTVDGVTVTLNAAVWDGQSLSISLTAEGVDLPEPQPATLYDAESYVRLAEEQREPYLRRQIAEDHAATHTDISEEKLDELVQSSLKWPDEPDLHAHFSISGQEENTLTIEAGLMLFTYVEKPVLTLHIENLAMLEESEDGVYGTMISPDGTIETDYELGAMVLRGPYDFTFTLDKLIAPVCYESDLELTYHDISVRIPQITITPFEARANYEISDGKITYEDILDMRINTLWMEDGEAVTCVGGPTMSQRPDGGFDGEIVCPQLHLVDPAKVTAVDIGGTRVELSKFERIDE